MNIVIRNARLVNEGKVAVADVLIKNGRVERIDSLISLKPNAFTSEINADGLYLLPGVIDDQVHFREPGLTHKATIYSESRAAAAGGITSFMDMPNTIPNTLTLKLLEDKYSIAAQKSLVNYSFFMGINKYNLEEVLQTDTENVCGVTDDGLYFNSEEGILANYPDYLEKLFSRTNTLVALHSEDDSIIKNNLKKFKEIYGENIPVEIHPLIRSEEACLKATERVLNIAKKHKNRLHLFHISTLAEAKLFDDSITVRNKRITAEACVHHLWFSDKDYEQLEGKIKWNPSIKTEMDRTGLIKSLLENKIDIIATDHAPHTIEEKTGNYFQTHSGGPLVQHALPAMLELFHKGEISIEKIVEKMSHNVSDAYRIIERGYIREGYFADLVLVNLNQSWQVEPENILSKCKWSPFEKQTFKSKVIMTFVNGQLAYNNGIFNENCLGKRLKFEKYRC